MKRRIAKIAILVALVTGFGVPLWWVTRGNAVWRVHQNYPKAEVRYSPEMSGDLSFDGLIAELIRATGIDFRSGDEPLGVDIRGAEVECTDFRGMTINHMKLTDCVVTDLRPLLTEYHPYVTFSNCDLTAVPEEHLKFLNQDQGDPNVYRLGNFFLKDGISKPYPGGAGLHTYSLFP